MASAAEKQRAAEAEAARKAAAAGKAAADAQAKSGTPPATAPVAAAAPVPGGGGAVDYGALAGGDTGGSSAPLSYALEVLLGNLGLSSDAADKVTVDVTGVGKSATIYGPPMPGQTQPAKARKIVTIRQALATLDELSTDELTTLQRNLYSAGFYPGGYYGNDDVEPKYGDRYGDDGFEAAFTNALKESLKTSNTVPFDQLVTKRAEQYRPVLQAKQQAKIDRATSQSKQAVAEQEAAQAKARAAAEESANAAPKTVMPTQEVTVPALSEIGRTVDDVATRLLGRTASDRERAEIGQMIQDSFREFGLRSADVSAFNRQLGDPYATAGGQATGGNPALNPGSAQPSAPMSEFDLASIPESTPGYGQLTNPKANQNAVRTFVDINKQYGTSFLGIVGDEAHKARKSDHNTWDAVDMGVKDPATRKRIADQLVAEASARGVTMVIEGKNKWTPAKGWQPYTGDPHEGHVHASFTRKAPAAQASLLPAGSGPVDVAKLTEALTASEGGVNVRNKAGSSASGFYQITDATWGKYKGYAKAMDAPREVQFEKAQQIMQANLNKFGDPELAVLAYYLGPNTSKAKLEAARTSTQNPTPGMANMAPKDYLSRVMQKYQGGVQVGAPATTQVMGGNAVPNATGPGNSTARGVTPYNGAVLTPSGGNALVTTSVDAAGMAEAQFRANNQPEMVGQQVLRARNIFEQLFRGN